MLRLQPLDRSGQAIFEFLLSAGVLLLTLTGAGWVFHLQWIKSKCAVLTFEETHARAHETVPSIQASRAGIQTLVRNAAFGQTALPIQGPFHPPTQPKVQAPVQIQVPVRGPPESSSNDGPKIQILISEGPESVEGQGNCEQSRSDVGVAKIQ